MSGYDENERDRNLLALFPPRTIQNRFGIVQYSPVPSVFADQTANLLSYRGRFVAEHDKEIPAMGIGADIDTHIKDHKNKNRSLLN